jgi:hypothetical protein
MDAGFDGAQFSGDAGRDTGFIGARARPAKYINSWPATWTTREACEAEEDGWLCLVRVEEQP